MMTGVGYLAASGMAGAHYDVTGGTYVVHGEHGVPFHGEYYFGGIASAALIVVTSF
jgi:hypothetical protein